MLGSSGWFISVHPPSARKISSTINFTATIKLLKFADSLMPMTRIAVTTTIPRNAIRLKTPCRCGRVGIDAQLRQLLRDTPEKLPMPLVEHERRTRRPRQLRRQPQPEVLPQAQHVAAPARAHRGRAKRILQHQVPADDPREDLA